jgi:hypothetical protein
VKLVNDGGTWLKNSLEKIEEKGVLVVKEKLSKKNFKHIARLLYGKIVWVKE